MKANPKPESDTTIQYTAQLGYRIGVIARELLALRQVIHFMPKDVSWARMLAIKQTIDSLQTSLSDLQYETDEMYKQIRLQDNG